MEKIGKGYQMTLKHLKIRTLDRYEDRAFVEVNNTLLGTISYDIWLVVPVDGDEKLERPSETASPVTHLSDAEQAWQKLVGESRRINTIAEARAKIIKDAQIKSSGRLAKITDAVIIKRSLQEDLTSMIMGAEADQVNELVSSKKMQSLLTKINACQTLIETLK